MKFPSLSRGCEIAQFFVRYMASSCRRLIWRLPGDYPPWRLNSGYVAGVEIAQFMLATLLNWRIPLATVHRGENKSHFRLSVETRKMHKNVDNNKSNDLAFSRTIIASNCIHPKRRFWKDKQKMKSGFSTDFSRAWVLDLGYEPLKSQSKFGFHRLFILPESSFGEHKLSSSMSSWT
jgi:hypothetical protein